MILIVSAWWVCGVIAWFIAERRGFGAWLPWIVTGVIFGPLSILFAAIVPSPPDEF